MHKTKESKMNPQHDERTTGDLNRQAASAAQRRKEKRNVAVATATGLLAVALAGGSLAFTAIDRSEAQVSATVTATVPQRPANQANRPAKPNTTPTAEAQKSIIERIIERVIIKERAPKPGPSPKPVITPTPTDPQDPASVAVDAARNALAGYLGVSVDDVFFSLVERVEFANDCLEVVLPGIACGQVVTPGFRIELVHDDTIYTYHTSLRGPHLFLADQRRVNPGPIITNIVQNLVSPYDGTTIVAGYDDSGQALIVRYDLDGNPIQLFGAYGYNLGTMLLSSWDGSLVVQLENIGDGLHETGIYRILFDGQLWLVQGSMPSLGYRALAFSPDGQYLLVGVEDPQANPSCQLLLAPLAGGSTIDLAVQTMYPNGSTACESYAWDYGANMLTFDVMASDQPGTIVESWQADVRSGALVQTFFNDVIVPPVIEEPPVEEPPVEEPPVEEPPVEEPPVEEEGKFALLGLTEAQVYEFLTTLQGLVATRNGGWMAEYVAYPLSVTIDGVPTTIHGPHEFMTNYDAIMHEGVSSAVLSQNPGELFVSDQGIMIGNGEVWLAPSEYGSLQIIAINN
jgi:hypothetical protein